MKTATNVARGLVGITGLIQIVLGGLFWLGQAEKLVPVHVLSGIVLVISMLVLAGLAARAGVHPSGLVTLSFVWALLMLILGLTQERILPGSAHWIIEVLHLLVGLAAMGLAGRLGTMTLARLGPEGGVKGEHTAAVS